MTRGVATSGARVRLTPRLSAAVARVLETTGNDTVPKDDPAWVGRGGGVPWAG